MTTDQERKLPFSQRTGLVAVLPQLELGEVSTELRRLLWYAVYKDFRTCVSYNYTSYIEGR